MNKFFTSVLIMVGLLCSASTFAQEITPDSLKTDSTELVNPIDTIELPSVVGVDSIEVDKFYLMYNKGLSLYLSLEGKGVENPDSAALWQFSSATGSTTIGSGEHFITMSGSLFGGWSASIGYGSSTMTIRNTEGVFTFSASATLAGTRYVGLNANGVLAPNQNNAGERNQWLLVEQDAPVIEEEPTNGYRIISVSGSSSRLEYVIGYPSVRPDGTEVELSGWLAVPTRNGAFNGDHFLMSSHYTMTKNSEVPSAAGPMESTIYSLSSSKPVMVAPDYLGYGITADEVHPYVAPDIMARNCYDMLMAAHRLLEQKFNVRLDTLKLPTYGVGYSQGGSIALAIQKYIENSTEISDSLRSLINYSGTRCGAGPYDPLATLSQYIYQDSLSMPVAAPLLVIGLVNTHQDLMQGYTAADYFSDAFNAAGLIDTIATRRYTTSELNSAIIQACGGGTMHVMLSDSALDLNSALMQPFMKTLGMSNLTRDWAPKAPIQFFHNTGDDVVPFLNTMSAFRALFDVAEGGLNLSMTSSPQGHTDAAVSFMLPVMTGGYKSFSAADSIVEYPVAVKEPGREGIAFWWHSVELEATQGGSIYATGDWRLPLSEEDYGTNLLVDWVVAGANGKSSLYAWAQPEEGYEFVGWYSSDSVLLSTEAVEARLFTMSFTSAQEDGIVNNTNYYPSAPQAKYTAVFAPILDGSITTSLDMKPAYPADNIMYDVLGRRIATSARGQIYILNGKKYIQQ